MEKKNSAIKLVCKSNIPLCSWDPGDTEPAVWGGEPRPLPRPKGEIYV